MRLEATQQTRLAGADVIPSISARVAALDWATARHEQDEGGSAVIGSLLTQAECETLASGYDADACFRSRVVIARHGFGQGEYKYYAYPLPEPVATLRTALYPKLAEIANEWEAALGREARFPLDHSGYLARCQRPARCGPPRCCCVTVRAITTACTRTCMGNCTFPCKVAVLLSRPGEDFTGGEFALTEQRPRMQSRIEVVPLRQGEAVVFAVNQRPVQGVRGVYRVAMRHGVSRLRSGRRYTLGVTFHDAK